MNKIAPKISIITPSFNQGDYIEATICSILKQNYPNLDYWIIDGGSTDQTISIIKQYEQHLTGWISEPDSGQVDAINKGLQRISGEWFNWINSDDLLPAGALQTLREMIHNHQPELIFASVENFIGSETRNIEHPRNISLDNLIMQHVLKKGVAWHQPGIWMKTALLHKAGGINPNFHYRFDMDMLIRVLAQQPKYICQNTTLARFRLHASSKTVADKKKFGQEHLDILNHLATEPKLKPQRPLIQQTAQRLTEHHWWETLEADPNRSRWQKLKHIYQQKRSQTLNLTNRKAIRTILRILIRGYYDRYAKASA